MDMHLREFLLVICLILVFTTFHFKLEFPLKLVKVFVCLIICPLRLLQGKPYDHAAVKSAFRFGTADYTSAVKLRRACVFIELLHFHFLHDTITFAQHPIMSSISIFLSHLEPRPQPTSGRKMGGGIPPTPCRSFVSAGQGFICLSFPCGWDSPHFLLSSGRVRRHMHAQFQLFLTCFYFHTFLLFLVPVLLVLFLRIYILSFSSSLF